MYKVIKSFTDIQDDGHKYNVGDTFPRDGVDVSQARLDKLAGSLNRQGTPLIKKVVEEKPEVKVVPEKVAQQDTSIPAETQPEATKAVNAAPKRGRKKKED